MEDEEDEDVDSEGSGSDGNLSSCKYKNLFLFSIISIIFSVSSLKHKLRF